MCMSNLDAQVSKMQSLMAEKSIKMISENNPIMAHKFSADPAVLVYKDTVYVYSTNDMQQLEYSQGKEENRYNKINTLNLYSSKDLVNWTDLGEIAVAGKTGSAGDAKWATNSWAPAIACKNVGGKDKFFLYFADSGNGIGVLTADSPEGPFTDPIKKPLISRQTPNCANVNWLFDPAVFVDKDGKGYLYFGGGHDPEKYEHPKTARCVALADDMISIVGTPETIDAPFLFEDSGINRIGDTYYYTYCTNWTSRDDSKDKDKMPIAVIGYMTSKSPLGPFEYKGYTLENPSTYFGTSGNNHHWIFEFKNKWYIAYHAQTLEKIVGLEKGGYRSLFINDFNINSDGSLPVQRGTKDGVKQLTGFNPFEKVPAATFHSGRYAAVTSKQTLFATKDKSYVIVKGVDFSKEASKIELEFADAGKKGSAAFYVDSFRDEANCLVSVKAKKNKTVEKKIKFDSKFKGQHDLYIVLSEGTELVSWQFLHL